MAENTCRICRCEATPDNPLFYPCKCRGSIKFIHQDCLLEWLNHSQKDPKCDICNTPYNFTIVYEENTPEKVPAFLIIKKTFQLAVSMMTLVLIIVNSIFFILIQTPIFFKVIARIFSWIVDKRLPYPESISRSLMFGDYYLLEENKKEPFDVTAPLTTKQLFLLFKLTFVQGLFYLLVLILIHLVLFLVHELVTRDEGYQPLIDKRFPLSDLEIVEYARERDRRALNRLVRHAFAVNRNPQNAGELHDDAHNLLDREIRNLNAPFPVNPAFMNDHVHDIHLDDHVHDNENQVLQPFQHIPAANDVNNILGRGGPNPRGEQLNNFMGDIRHNGDENPNEDLHDIIAHHQELAHQMNETNPNNFAPEDDSDAWEDEDEVEVEVGDDEVEVNPQAQNPQAAERVENNQNMVVRGRNFQLQIKADVSVFSPLKAACIVDPILTVWLAVAYLTPLAFGNDFLILSVKAFLFLYRKTGMLFLFNRLLESEVYKQSCAIITENFLYESNLLARGLLNVTNFLYQAIVKPPIALFNNIYSSNYPPTFFERLTVLAISYWLSLFLLYRVMKFLEARRSARFKRKFAIFLFECFSTLKVFFIFLLELVIFPIYCGFLVDFAIAPLILEKFELRVINPFDKHSTVAENVFNFFSSDEFENLVFSNGWPFALKIVFYWILGTTYMCFLSLFVGMTRTHILRPGVLYFIRSPDDQNVRLLHDALVKPLGLQLLRIALSALIYTVFIIVCIGAVTYSIRFGSPYLLTNSANEPVQILPMKAPYNIGSFLLMNPIIWRISLEQQLIIKYVRLYWKRAFRLICHNLRLSSFILDIDNPKERGHLVYRNIFYRLFSNEEPDYSRPQSQRQVDTFFQQNSQVNVVFIPDGNYVRAPDHEATSRRALRKLFVPVTKDDVLLVPIKEVEPKTNKYEDDIDSEQEDTSTDTYTVVYRPPSFKYRVMGLLLYIWALATALIISVTVVSLLAGRPAVLLLCRYRDSPLVKFFTLGNLEVYCANSFEIDLHSIMIGIVILLTGLSFYDKHYGNRKPIEVDVLNDDSEDEDYVEEEDSDENSDEDHSAVGLHIDDDTLHDSDDDLAAEDDIAEDDGLIEILEPQSSKIRAVIQFIVPVAQKAIHLIWSVLKLNFAALCISLLTSVYFFVAHIICVDIPYSYFTGSFDFASFSLDLDVYVMTLNLTTVAIHSVVSLFTVIPFILRIFNLLKRTATNGLAESFSYDALMGQFFWPVFEDMISYYAPVFMSFYLLGFFIEAASNFEYYKSLVIPVSTSPVFTSNDVVAFIGKFKVTTVGLRYFLHALALVVALGIKSAVSVKLYFDVMNELVKNEIYGKSQRLENMEVDTNEVGDETTAIDE